MKKLFEPLKPDYEQKFARKVIDEAFADNAIAQIKPTLRCHEITSTTELVKKSKGTGWCTKHRHDANRYLANGRIWQFRKVGGKGRPSFQLYLNSTHASQWELKARGNRPVRPREFIQEFPDQADFITETLPGYLFADPCEMPKHQNYAEHAEDGFVMLEIADQNGIDSTGNPYSVDDVILRFNDNRVVSIEQVSHIRTDEEIKAIDQACVDSLPDSILQPLSNDEIKRVTL